jgi:hypothetical protein
MRFAIRLQLLLGSPLPRPAPREIADAVERIEVACADDAPGAFQILFKAGRGGPGGRVDQQLLRSGGLAAGSRMVIVVYVGPRPSVLLDGVITHREYAPGASAGTSVVAVTGDDLTQLMDEEQRIVAYPAMGDAAIATALLGRYAQHGISPQVVPPLVVDQPVPAQRVPVQHGTDLDYLRRSAARAGHVFLLRPGPLPLASVGYWGPAAALAGRPLPALSVTSGDPGYLTDARFLHDALAPARVSGSIADVDSGQTLPLAVVPVAVSALVARPARPRRSVLAAGGGGLGASVVRARAQAFADASISAAVTVEGEVDTARYGAVVQPHRLVGVRGAGRSFDGLYRVRHVTHVLRPGEYRQRLQLARPGLDTTTPVVSGGPA